MTNKEKLENAVQELKSKISNREQQIGKKIKDIDCQLTAKNAELKTARQAQVEADLAEDTVTVAKFKKQVNSLKTKIAEFQERREALFQVKDHGDYSKDLAGIKKLAAAANDERSTEIHKYIAEMNSLDAEIEKLTEKRKQAFRNYGYALDQKPCGTIEPLIGLIDKRAANLDYLKKPHFLESWLNGGDLEVFFPEPEPLHKKEVFKLEPSEYGDWKAAPDGQIYFDDILKAQRKKAETAQRI
jgi:phage host-nuclease inhibitor protein Gam